MSAIPAFCLWELPWKIPGPGLGLTLIESTITHGENPRSFYSPAEVYPPAPSFPDVSTCLAREKRLGPSLAAACASALSFDAPPIKISLRSTIRNAHLSCSCATHFVD